MSTEEKQTPWQLIIGIATVIGAVAIIAKLFKKDEDEIAKEKRLIASQRSRDHLYINAKPSFADYQYVDFAKILTTALMLNNTEDEQAVYSVFNKFKNISDLVKTIEFFGTSRKMYTTQYITLPEAIIQYFNDSEIKKLNDILRKKKINYSF